MNNHQLLMLEEDPVPQNQLVTESTFYSFSSDTHILFLSKPQKASIMNLQFLIFKASPQGNSTRLLWAEKNMPTNNRPCNLHK